MLFFPNEYEFGVLSEEQQNGHKWLITSVCDHTLSPSALATIRESVREGTAADTQSWEGELAGAQGSGGKGRHLSWDVSALGPSQDRVSFSGLQAKPEQGSSGAAHGPLLHFPFLFSQRTAGTVTPLLQNSYKDANTPVCGCHPGLGKKQEQTTKPETSEQNPGDTTVWLL